MALVLNVAGRSIRIGPGGNWIATLPPGEREEQFEAYPELEELWDEQWGDRGSQLVVIGIELDHESVQNHLEHCLLTDDEMDADWDAFDDRFPTFEPAEVVEDGDSESLEHDGQEEIGIAD